jgi:hypothetical protein
MRGLHIAFRSKNVLIYPDDRVLVAVMNNLEDWRRVQEEGWYRIPAKHALEPVPNIDILAFYFTKAFGADKWAVHYYAAVKGHELLTRRDLIPTQPDHSRANDWYYKFELGPLQHKIPPIISYNWRRISFIYTTGDRFEQAEEINDLFEDQSPAGRLYVTLKEDGFHPERDWPLREKGEIYQVDLAVPLGNNRWLPIVFDDRDIPPKALHFPPNTDPVDCLKTIRQRWNEAYKA